MGRRRRGLGVATGAGVAVRWVGTTRSTLTFGRVVATRRCFAATFVTTGVLVATTVPKARDFTTRFFATGFLAAETLVAAARFAGDAGLAGVFFAAVGRAVVFFAAVFLAAVTLRTLVFLAVFVGVGTTEFSAGMSRTFTVLSD